MPPQVQPHQIHPTLAFTRLGAFLRHHSHEPHDVGNLATQALTAPHDQPLDLMPLHLLRDALQPGGEYENHPLASQFNWHTLPEAVAVDDSLRRHATRVLANRYQGDTPQYHQWDLLHNAAGGNPHAHTYPFVSEVFGPVQDETGATEHDLQDSTDRMRSAAWHSRNTAEDSQVGFEDESPRQSWNRVATTIHDIIHRDGQSPPVVVPHRYSAHQIEYDALGSENSDDFTNHPQNDPNPTGAILSHFGEDWDQQGGSRYSRDNTGPLLAHMRDAANNGEFSAHHLGVMADHLDDDYPDAAPLAHLFRHGHQNYPGWGGPFLHDTDYDTLYPITDLHPSADVEQHVGTYGPFKVGKTLRGTFTPGLYIASNEEEGHPKIAFAMEFPSREHLEDWIEAHGNAGPSNEVHPPIHPTQGMDEDPDDSQQFPVNLSQYSEPSSSKASQMLHDGTAHGHTLTNKQRKYFGWLSHRTDHSGNGNQTNYMTTENDFHRHLDEHPDDHHTRLVFADWLDEQNDPRGAGYRALGVLGVKPWDKKWEGYSTDPGYTCQSNSYVITEPEHYKVHALPDDWFARISKGHPSWTFEESRRAAEDAAAHAFSQLPPERQRELLETPVHYERTDYAPPAAGTPEWRDQGMPSELPPYGDDERRLHVLNHEPLYRMWIDHGGDAEEGDPLEDGFIDAHRDAIDNVIRQYTGDTNFPSRYEDQTDYAMNESDEAAQQRQGFESAIDANPLDPLNHLVYADWLQDQGDHDEADFRRKMGNWYGDTYPTVHVGHINFPWWIHRRMDVPHYLPEGVWQEYLPGAGSNFRVNHTNSPHETHPALISNGLYWATRKDMEGAFRQAHRQNLANQALHQATEEQFPGFMDHLDQNDQEQLSLYADTITHPGPENWVSSLPGSILDPRTYWWMHRQVQDGPNIDFGGMKGKPFTTGPSNARIFGGPTVGGFTDQVAAQRDAFRRHLAENPRDGAAHMAFSDWLRQRVHEQLGDQMVPKGKRASRAANLNLVGDSELADHHEEMGRALADGSFEEYPGWDDRYRLSTNPDGWEHLARYERTDYSDPFTITSLARAAAHDDPNRHPLPGQIRDAVMDMGHPLAEATMDAAHHTGTHEADAAISHLHEPNFTHALLTLPDNTMALGEDGRDNPPVDHGTGVRPEYSRATPIRLPLGRHVFPKRIRASRGNDMSIALGGRSLTIMPHVHYPFSRLVVEHHVPLAPDDEGQWSEHRVRRVVTPRELAQLAPTLSPTLHRGVMNWLDEQVPEHHWKDQAPTQASRYEMGPAGPSGWYSDDQIEYGPHDMASGTEGGQTAGGLIHEFVHGGPHHTLGVLSDLLQEHDHPVTPFVRRVYEGNATEVTPNFDSYGHERESSRTYRDEHSLSPTLPSHIAVLPAADGGLFVDPNTGDMTVTYLNHPTGHTFKLGFRSSDLNRRREFHVPVTPDEVAEYALQWGEMGLGQKNQSDHILRTLAAEPGTQEEHNPFHSKPEHVPEAEPEQLALYDDYQWGPLAG